MGREKRAQPGQTAKDRHKRAGKISKAIDRREPLPPGLVAAKPVNALTKSKHQSYFEFIENKDKKKPLLFEITPDRTPPPGMKYIPIGNPELTERCKEISRDEGASVYIVTFAKKEASELTQQVHRVGHHIREYIVERAMRQLGQDTFYEPRTTGPNEVEEIPRSQLEINKQADAALRELFPRIPNTDRQQIIDHAFRKGKHFNGELVVGLQQDLSLSRRVQLAVLAHIRHNHTRYDQLLRETTWHNARRATEPICLDILVKWRGDDENGRNQLDEILREVVVLSDDDDDDDSGDEPDSDSSAVLTDRSVNSRRVSAPAARNDIPNGNRLSTAVPSRPGSLKPLATPGNSKKISKKQRKRGKHRERNFSRYEAARNLAWDSAKKRQHLVSDTQASPPGVVDGSVSHGTYPQNQPVAFIEGRAPVIDHGLGHPQTRPTVGPFVPDRFHEASPRVDRSFAAQPVHSHYFPSGSTIQKVNELSSVQDPGTLGPEGSRQLPSHQLQDYLHPSIEPRSPDAVRLPSRYTRPLVEYADLGGDESQYRVHSPSRGPVVREGDRYLPRRMTQGYPNHTRTISDGYDPFRAPTASYHSVSQENARPPAYLPARDYGSDRAYGRDPRVLRQDDQLLRRNEGVLGERANPIMIEDQPVHPETVYLGPGESVRDRFGPNVEILSVRRPVRDAGPAPERQRAIPMDEGFIRLRENRPMEPRNGLQEEGFLRLREHSGSVPPQMPTGNGRSRPGEFRSTLDPYRYQSAEAPEQAIYVRRADRAPPADLSYPVPGPQRMERVRNERLVQRDLPSPTHGGAHVEQYLYHQPQGAYGIPVHSLARPAPRPEDTFRFDRHPPPPPPGQLRWPRASDDVIVLE